MIDLLEGAPELAINGAIPTQLGRALAADSELTSIARRSARTAGIGRGLTSLCCGLAMWGALLGGVAAVHAGRMNGVLLAGIALVPLVAFELVALLPSATQTLQRVRRSAARVLEVIDTVAPVVEPPQPRPLPRGPHALHARRLSVRYPGSTRLALAGLELDLRPGRRVALIGPSGAGKTTLAAVALRFLPYEGGSVALNGVEIAELAGDDCRRVVGLVSQDAHVFDSTLEENLRLARRDATGEQLREALASVRLLDWAERLPAGMATELGERGARMSGGQRQRLAIARALLADFPVLVLDEPGEHLDTLTADAIVTDLLAITRDRATLLITHRLAGLEEIDEVLVLDHGRVLERGTHAELLGLGGATRSSGSASARRFADGLRGLALPPAPSVHQRALQAESDRRAGHHQCDVRGENGERAERLGGFSKPGGDAEVRSGRNGRHRYGDAHARTGARLEQEHPGDTGYERDRDRLVVDMDEPVQDCVVDVERRGKQREFALGKREDGREHTTALPTRAPRRGSASGSHGCHPAARPVRQRACR